MYSSVKLNYIKLASGYTDKLIVRVRRLNFGKAILLRICQTKVAILDYVHAHICGLLTMGCYYILNGYIVCVITG